MDNLLNFIPELPVADFAEYVTDKTADSFSFLFDPIKENSQIIIDLMTDGLTAIPAVILIALVALLAFFASGKKFGLAIFSVVGLWFIYNQGLWEDLMFTLTLVLFSSLLSVLIGVPFGILMAKSKIANSIINPILDFMQTMPAFVYLIPAVAFFGIGMVPGVLASLIFAIPPTVRFTNLGIRQVSTELVEAAESFGSTGAQRLFKVELPLAKATIMAGINQTVMLSLSMVVIASMIGAPGLGRNVLSALQRAQIGSGFVSGLALVVLAIIIDRLTQKFSKKS
jgi:glycine betaine/proline transport system permease protein/glycine betaine/proline transport system substrate-binding protein